MIGRCEGDDCRFDNCPGTLRILPPLHKREHGCYCSTLGRMAPCGWCEGHELRCDVCSRLPEDGDEMTIEIEVGPLVSLDTPEGMCNQSNILRIAPELHFPLNEVFEVPDEFNGHQRGTHYYRNSRGVLRGPFMNAEEAGFDLCRRPFT